MIILLMILLIRGCMEEKPIPTVVTTKDTMYIKVDSTITHYTPKVIEKIPVPVEKIVKEYVPDTNYAELVNQYRNLAYKYEFGKVYKDSIKIDTIGYVKITDIISKNEILSRSAIYSLKYPVIKEIEKHIVPEPPKYQFYMGVGLTAEQKDLFKYLNASFLYKTKKDQIFGISTGINRTGDVNFTATSYWKIKLFK